MDCCNSKGSKKAEDFRARTGYFQLASQPESYRTGDIVTTYEGPKEVADFVMQNTPPVEIKMAQMLWMIYQRRTESSGVVEFMFPGGKVHANDPEEVEHQFLFDGIYVKSTESNKDELVILLDGQDSRIKSLNAPFELYLPNTKYNRTCAQGHRY